MRTIPDPGFAGDDGSPPDRLSAALSVYAQDPDGGYLPALAALCSARLLVPVVTVPGEMPVSRTGRSDSGRAASASDRVEMAAVLMQRADGRKALLAFTSTAALADWNADGRPVPVPSATAALSAIQDGADALLVDLAGPVHFVVEGPDLTALARGWSLVRLPDVVAGGWGWQTDVQ